MITGIDKTSNTGQANPEKPEEPKKLHVLMDKRMEEARKHLSREVTLPEDQSVRQAGLDRIFAMMKLQNISTNGPDPDKDYRIKTLREKFETTVVTAETLEERKKAETNAFMYDNLLDKMIWDFFYIPWSKKMWKLIDTKFDEEKWGITDED